MATGTATTDFGAFPGTAEARLTVAGQTGILATTLVEVWPLSTNSTADHSGEEHAIEDFDCNPQDIVPEASFVITVRPRRGRCYGTYKFGWGWI